MATTTKRTRFSRRLPDHVTDELCNVLAEDKVFGFNDLFERVFDNLKVRNAVSGGEEMLRLRAYEKLQNLVTRGLVEKLGKLGFGKTALVIDGDALNISFAYASGNLRGVNLMPAVGANVYDILNHDTLVLTRAAIEKLEARFNG